MNIFFGAWVKKIAFGFIPLIISFTPLVSTAIAPLKVSLRVNLGVAVDAPAVPAPWVNNYFPEHTVTWDSDFDNDGMLDYMEYYAGTIPDDGTSFLKINSLDVAGDAVTITWASSPSLDPEGREYIVYSAEGGALSQLINPELTLSDYETLAQNPEVSGINRVGSQAAATGAVETSIVHQGVGLESGRFYRVFLVKPLPE